MIVYSQILIWGQSSVCLLLCTVMNSIPQMNKSFPNLFSGMVPLGIEAGPDVIPTAVYKNLWSQTVVQESETLGLFACCVLSILVISAKQYYSYDIFESVAGKSSDGENDYNIKTKSRKEAYTKRAFGSGEFEAFRRGPQSPKASVLSSVAQPARNRHSSSSSPALASSLQFHQQQQQQQHEAETGMSAQWGLPPTDASMFRRDMFLDSDAHLDDHLLSRTAKAKNFSSLGTHVALIFICVFLSFNFGLVARFFEAEIEWFKAHRILSGIRLFEMSIVFSIVIIHYLLLYTKLSFRTEWFMRLSGLMLDMTCIAKLASAIPDPKNVEEVHYGLISVFVLACTLWNIYVFVYFAKEMFPNFYFERAVVLSADAMGHPAMGLLFARTLDPEMSTPVPVAYICKLAMFVVPSSGGKNTIVISLVDRHGPLVALVICVCVVGAWAMIFDQYLKTRYVNTTAGAFSKVAKKFSVTAADIESGGQMPHLALAASPAVRAGISSHGLRNREEGGARDVNFNFSDDNSFGENKALLSEDVLEFDEEEEEEDGAGESSNSVTAEDRAGGGGGAGRAEEGAAAARKNSSLALSGKDFPDIEVKMSHDSSIMSYSQLQEIASWLPLSVQTKKFVLKYSLQRDGASLATMLSLCQTGANDCFSSLIVIEDSWGYIFGGYVASALTNSRSYYGTGESFVYSLAPAAKVYHSEGGNDLFVLSSVDQLLMGGGGEGFAFQLDDELNTGVSNRSDTFRNPQLASNEFFKCLNVEVWTTESPGYNV